MATQPLPQPEYSRNMRLIGHSDQGGRPDGVQVMVHRGYAYIGHMVSQGFSIVDVRDAKNPRPAGYIPAPPGTWNVHLQAHDDLLLVINARDLFADVHFADEKVYYTRAIGQTLSAEDARNWSAGVRIFDISTPDRPREIGFLALEGIGVHRIWYVGGR
ncbi:MAG: hypothetical protein HYZ77_05835, partial [Serratia liquefaciens]|nr:hypothetical protein [Serratia liquefaciens]